MEHVPLGDLDDLSAKAENLEPERLASCLSAAIAIVGPELTEPNQARSLISIAGYAAKARLWREAIALVRPIIDCKETSLAPAEKRLTAHLILGLARKELANVREAVVAFASAEYLVRDVDDRELLFQYHSNYAAVLHDAGLTEAALNQFAAASAYSEAASDYLLAAFHMNRSMALLADKRPAQAIEELKRGLALDDGTLETRLKMSLGNAYAEAGEPDQAQASYAHALNSLTAPDPRMEARIRNNFGRLLLKRGDHEGGLAELELGLKLRRDSGDLLGQAASLKFKAEAMRSLGRDREAQSSLDEAADLLASLGHPDFGETLQHALALGTPIAGQKKLRKDVAAVAAALSVPDMTSLKVFSDTFPALADERGKTAWEALEERFASRASIRFRIKARRQLIKDLAAGRDIDEPGGGDVQPALEDLIHATDAAALEAVLRANQHCLLTDTALRMVDGSRAVWMDRQREDIVKRLDGIRRLIETSRKKGVEFGLAEFSKSLKQIEDLRDLAYAYLRQDMWLARKRFFQLHADRLLVDEFPIALDQLRQVLANGPAMAKQLDDLLAIWRSCRSKGLHVAFAELPAESVDELIARVVNVGTWEETRGLAEVHHAQLATDGALKNLRSALEKTQQESLDWYRIKDHIQLLEECRRDGIESAFEHRSGSKMYVGRGQTPDNPALDGSIANDSPNDEIARLEALLPAFSKATADPLFVGALHNSIACRYLDRMAEDEEPNLRKAEDHLTKALGMLDEAVNPQTASRAMNNAGNLCVRYAAIRPSERNKLLLRAIKFYEDALRIQSPEFMVETSRTTARNLYEAIADLREDIRSPELVARAAAVCTTALDATDRLARSGLSGEVRDLIEGAEWAVRGAVRNRVALRQFGAALEASERGKGRAFAARLIEFDRAVPTRVPREFVDREHAARAELAVAQKENSGVDDAAARFARTARISKANDELDDVYDEMEPYAPDFVAIRRNRPMKFAELERFWDGSKRLCLEWHFQEDSSYLFVLGHGRGIEAYTLPLGIGNIIDYVTLAVDDFWHPPERPDDRISPIWARLADQLFPEGCRARICDADAITLIPNGIQRFIPIHALPISWLNYEPLIAKMPVRYLPSLTIGRRIAQRAKRSSGRMLALGYGGRNSREQSFEQEARVASEASREADLFPGRAASFECLKAASPGAGIIHLSCHAFFDPVIPMNSGLVLAAHDNDGERIVTAEDIVASLQLDSALVVLSGCETAQADQGTVDEMVGLVQAFFVAGAGTVLAALWRVDVEVTLGLMQYFYKSYGKSGLLSESLRQAALSVRSKFATQHPYYWAPFIAYET